MQLIIVKDQIAPEKQIKYMTAIALEEKYIFAQSSIQSTKQSRV